MAQKSVTMAINDTKNAMVQIINNSGLNYAINELILRDLLIQCHSGAQKEYDNDVQQYQAELAKEQEEAAKQEAENQEEHEDDEIV